MGHIRAAAVAGAFYPGESAALDHSVRRYLGQANPSPRDQLPKAIIVPHAGYVYSGPVAAQAYQLLRPYAAQIRRVVLLGPVHRVAIRGLALPDSDSFATPLGLVPLDTAGMAAIADLPQISVNDAAHAWEHSLEVQLPFLQDVLEDFRLIPLAVGDATPDEVAEVLERLWGGAETLIVISSDLSHYLPYDDARARDSHTASRILQLDSHISHHEACGATPVNGLLQVARRHRLSPALLDLRNSGDTEGDRDRVVGYSAFAFYPEN